MGTPVNGRAKNQSFFEWSATPTSGTIDVKLLGAKHKWRHSFLGHFRHSLPPVVMPSFEISHLMTSYMYKIIAKKRKRMTNSSPLHLEHFFIYMNIPLLLFFGHGLKQNLDLSSTLWQPHPVTCHLSLKSVNFWHAPLPPKWWRHLFTAPYIIGKIIKKIFLSWLEYWIIISHLKKLGKCN